MVNKLLIVRVDNFTVQKLNLQIGDNIIGRGAATGHVDNPIAEKAVVINLAPTGEMSMTPMLACYMKSCCSNRWQSLKVGSTVVIRPGDICSLLPDRSWFKITSTDCSIMDEDNDVHGKRKAGSPSDEGPPNKKPRSDGDVATITTDVLFKLQRAHPVPDILSQSSSVEVIPSTSSNAGNTTESAPAEASTSSEAKNTAEGSADPTDNKETSASGSRDDAEKKIKWDCAQHFSDQTNQPTAETAEVPSAASASTEDNPPAADETSAPTEQPPRDKCTYGSQCFRRNPNHRERFSHPGDPDYEAIDERPECPYGVRCYRKNPQHKRDFKHTKNRRSRAQTPVRVLDPGEASATEISSAEESVDESEYEASLYDDTSEDGVSEYEDGTTDGEDL